MRCNKALITGGLGFIGLEVARQLVEEERSVLLFDNLSPQIHGAIPNFPFLPFLSSAKVEIVRGDVCGPNGWGTVLEDVTCIVHLAAETGTAQSMYEISKYTQTNVGGTASLLDHLANHKHRVSKIILASSRAVYGEGSYECAQCGRITPSMRTEDMLRRKQWEPRCPFCSGVLTAVAAREDDRTAPASVYAATKLAQEDLVRISGNALGIPTVICRFQNVFGEGQSLKNPYTGILSIFSNQLRLGQTVNLYEDGEESRDFVHVCDVARAVLLALESDRGDGYTLNVGSGRPTSVARIAALLAERIGGKTQTVVSGQYRLGDIRHGFADLSAIQDRLGFAPAITLEAGLDRFVQWVKRQPIEPDRLAEATKQLEARGLTHSDASVEAVTV